MNIFETRTLLEVVKDKNFGANAFLRDRFFANKKHFMTEKVDFDIIDDKGRRLAPFVNPKIGGKVMDRAGFRTNTYEAPAVSPETMTIADEFLKRSAGESVYGSKTPMQRASEAATADLQMLDEMITRREEKMCSQALFEGKVTIEGEGYPQADINFWDGISSADKPVTTLTGSSKWTDSSVTGDAILADIRTIRRTMIQKGGFTPKDMLVGKDVIEILLTKLTGSNAFDTRRVDMGMIDPQHLPNGVTYWGYLKDSALDVFTYDEQYEDGGTPYDLVPANKVLFGSSAVKTTMCYGAVCVADKAKNELGWFAEDRVPSSYINESPAGRIIKLQSRPLPVINQIYGFHILTPKDA